MVRSNVREIKSLSITSECLGIDSENLLFAKIKKDYSGLAIEQAEFEFAGTVETWDRVANIYNSCFIDLLGFYFNTIVIWNCILIL